jgi:hypothetical protein
MALAPKGRCDIFLGACDPICRRPALSGPESLTHGGQTEISNLRFEIADPKHQIRNTKSETPNPKLRSETPDPKQQVRDIKSQI